MCFKHKIIILEQTLLGYPHLFCFDYTLLSKFRNPLEISSSKIWIQKGNLILPCPLLSKVKFSSATNCSIYWKKQLLHIVQNIFMHSNNISFYAKLTDWKWHVYLMKSVLQLPTTTMSWAECGIFRGKKFLKSQARLNTYKYIMPKIKIWL